MLKPKKVLVSLVLCTIVLGLNLLSEAKTEISGVQPRKILGDNVILNLDPNLRVLTVQSITPGAPCTIMSYTPCNYFIPANDYVTFTLNPSINLTSTSCPATSLRSVTINFEATPSVPIFVWLSDGAGTPTTTTPVYMIGATKTIYQTEANLSNWFSATNFNRLCIQAIYPSPPPTTFYYPMSCTIVYQ